MGTATEYTLRQIQTLLEKIDDLQQALSSIAGDQLRVDQITAADPPFANITLSNLRDRICGLAPEETNLWGVWDRLNYIKIAIEKLDDLQQALHSIAGDELDVIVESSALPTGAATEAKQDSILAELQEKLETADLNLDADKDLQVDVKTIPTVTVQAGGGDKIFALECKIVQNPTLTVTTAGTNDLDTDTVPAGKIWVIRSASWVNLDTSLSRIELWGVSDGSGWIIDAEYSATAAQYRLSNFFAVLDAGDSLQCKFYGCAVDDRLRFNAWGYQMDAP